MKAVASRQVCFDAAKKSSNYREFRSMLKGKGCSLAVLKEAWAAKGEKQSTVQFLTAKTVSPKKTIQKDALKKAKSKKIVAIRNTPPVPIKYDRYLTQVKKDRDDQFVVRHAQAQKQSYKLVISLDLVPKKEKLNATEKNSILKENSTQIDTVVADLLHGYDLKSIKLADSEYMATIKANREWMGNESTVIKSVKAVFDDPNFYIAHGKKCNLGNQTLKLTLKSIKKV